MEINRFCFLIEAKEDISLPPFKGPALRGGLGHALKKIVCIYSGPCKEDDCPVRKNCVFKRLFEPKEGGRNIPAIETYCKHHSPRNNEHSYTQGGR